MSSPGDPGRFNPHGIIRYFMVRHEPGMLTVDSAATNSLNAVLRSSHSYGICDVQDVSIENPPKGNR